jgi:hypothetical protein
MKQDDEVVSNLSSSSKKNTQDSASNALHLMKFNYKVNELQVMFQLAQGFSIIVQAHKLFTRLSLSATYDENLKAGLPTIIRFVFF